MSYKELIVWQKAMDLSEEIYRLSKLFPKEEIYALTSQIRRAVVSVPSNIAEGNARASSADYRHFLSIAKGSLVDVETQILIAIRLKYILLKETQSAMKLIDEVGRMLTALRKKLE